MSLNGAPWAMGERDRTDRHDNLLSYVCFFFLGVSLVFINNGPTLSILIELN